MKISVTIPTLKNQIEVKEQLTQIVNTTMGLDIEIYASCKKQYAAHNRNDCINNTTGEIVVMADDDILFGRSGWCQKLIKPLLDSPDKYSIVSARCLEPNGKIGGLLGDAGDHTIHGDYQVAQHVKGSTLQLVASACIAFYRKDAMAIKNDVNLPFDEKYVQACWEDADYAMRMREVFPNRDIILNNTCQLVHLNRMAGRDSEGVRKNNRYFNSKWKVNI